jgi:nephrocystin-4
VVASFGQAVFFEFMLTNPYNLEHNFEISWDDAELRLVTDSTEWKYLRKVHGIKGPVEKRLIAERSGGVSEVYLLPNETLAIPFVFQSFHSGLVASQHSDELKTTKYGEPQEYGISARTTSVTFQ